MRCFPVLLLLPAVASADLSLDITKHGVVYRHPDMAKATVRKDLTLGDSPRFDLYLPRRKPGRLPVVVFVNGVGDVRGKLKEWEIYKDWARLVTTRGYAAILHEADPAGPATSIRKLFDRLAESGASLGIDPERIAVWSCSANVTPTLPLLMDAAPRGVRAAVIYYGSGAAKAMRKDLPVFWVLAGKDGAGLIQGQRALWKRAVEEGLPWTMVNAPTLPHAFDAVDTSDDSRRVVAATLAFFDAHLGTLPPPAPPSRARDILAATYGGNFAAAEKTLEAMVAESPRDADAWMTLGWARRNLGKAADAEKAYLKVLELDPKNVMALRSIAVAKAQSGDCEGAARRAGEMPMADGFLLADIGACELRGKKWEAGAKTLERAVESGAASPVVRYNLACAYAQLGRRADALAALEAAVDMGFADGKGIAEDTDLAPLRGEARFQALVARLTRP